MESDNDGDFADEEDFEEEYDEEAELYGNARIEELFDMIGANQQ